MSKAEAAFCRISAGATQGGNGESGGERYTVLPPLIREREREAVSEVFMSGAPTLAVDKGFSAYQPCDPAQMIKPRSVSITS